MLQLSLALLLLANNALRPGEAAVASNALFSDNMCVGEPASPCIPCQSCPGPASEAGQPRCLSSAPSSSYLHRAGWRTRTKIVQAAVGWPNLWANFRALILGVFSQSGTSQVSQFGPTLYNFRVIRPRWLAHPRTGSCRPPRTCWARRRPPRCTAPPPRARGSPSPAALAMGGTSRSDAA
jgi:hypothetical protein